MVFKDSQAAFDAAIEDGRLSTDRAQDNYAGNYMYMGTVGYGERVMGPDLFKNIETRLYDV